MIIFWKIILTILLTMLITCMVGAIGSIKGNKLCNIAFYTLAGEGFAVIVMVILHLWSII